MLVIQIGIVRNPATFKLSCVANQETCHLITWTCACLGIFPVQASKEWNYHCPFSMLKMYKINYKNFRKYLYSSLANIGLFRYFSNLLIINNCKSNRRQASTHRYYSINFSFYTAYTFIWDRQLQISMNHCILQLQYGNHVLESLESIRHVIRNKSSWKTTHVINSQFDMSKIR